MRVNERADQEDKQEDNWAEEAAKVRFYFVSSFGGFFLKLVVICIASAVLGAFMTGLAAGIVGGAPGLVVGIMTGVLLPIWWIVKYVIGNVRAEFELNEKLAEYIEKIAQRE